MDIMAALMVLVACHPDSGSCLADPVAVISYQNDDLCHRALPGELAKARRHGGIYYGDCVPVPPDLMAGRSVNRMIDPARLQAFVAGKGQKTGSFPALALSK